MIGSSSLQRSGVPFWKDELWALPTESQEGEGGLTGRLRCAFLALRNAGGPSPHIACSADEFVSAIGSCGLQSLLMAAETLKGEDSDEEHVYARSPLSRWPRRLRPEDPVANIEVWINRLMPEDRLSVGALLHLNERACIACAIYAAGLKVFLETSKENFQNLPLAALSMFSVRETAKQPPGEASAADCKDKEGSRARRSGERKVEAARAACVVVFSLMNQSPTNAFVATVFPSPELQATMRTARGALIRLGNSQSWKSTRRCALHVATELAPLVCHHVNDSIRMEPKARFYPGALILAQRMEKMLSFLHSKKRERVTDESDNDSDTI
jgi:hypothetical protein